MKRFFIIVLLLTLLPVALALAQPTGTITANPKAVKLRRIWMVRGSVLGGEEVGRSVGGLGDLFSDGFGAWGVSVTKTVTSHIYRGGADTLSTTPVASIHGLLSIASVKTHSVAGDFLGDGRHWLGIWREEKIVINATTFYLSRLPIFAIDSNIIDTTASYLFDPWAMDPPVMFGRDAFACDLDNDGADELVVVSPGIIREPYTGGSARGELWIFRGGADFQVDSPTAVFRDIEQHNSEFYVTTARVDADEFPDLIVGTQHRLVDGSRPWRVLLYRNLGHAPWFADAPDRIIETALRGATPNPYLSVLDADGDGLADFAGGTSEGDTAGLYLWRSGSGKDPFVRNYDRTDADVWLAGQSMIAGALQPGYLNDSSRRYQMLGAFNNGRMLLFAGGSAGPDARYDAFYSAAEDGLIDGPLFQSGSAINDVSGDGWSDMIIGSSVWYHGASSGGNPGIALILAGGPYIPRDSTMLHVREVAVAGRPAGLFVWPNPVVQELNIAWRGDLKQMPRHFEIHDMLGRIIASGSVDAGQGAALWQCDNIPAGVYLLSVYDGNHQPIATTHIIKQE